MHLLNWSSLPMTEVGSAFSRSHNAPDPIRRTSLHSLHRLRQRQFSTTEFAGLGNELKQNCSYSYGPTELMTQESQ